MKQNLRKDASRKKEYRKEQAYKKMTCEKDL